MPQSTICYLAILFLTLPCMALSLTDELKEWYSQIRDPRYDCPAPPNEVSQSDTYISQTASCEDPESTFAYDYKVASYNTFFYSKNSYFLQIPGGKKPNKGPFNGSGILSFGFLQKMGYGLKNRKCLKVGYTEVTKISGVFVEDLLEVG